MAKTKNNRLRGAAADTKAVEGKSARAGVGRIASYRLRKRAVEKGIDEAIRVGVAVAFNRAVNVVSDVNPKGNSKHFVRMFDRRLKQFAAAREAEEQI